MPIRLSRTVSSSSRNLCQLVNLGNCSTLICSVIKSLIQTIILRSSSLSSHGDRTALSNNLLLVCLVDVTSQGGDQQGGQDGQDDQNDDELYQGEAFLFFILRIFSNMTNSSNKFSKDIVRPHL